MKIDTTEQLTTCASDRQQSARPGPDLIDVLAEARKLPDFADHHRVLEVRDDGVGLRAFIAIHDVSLGPALGGCRMVPYASREAAITDALRLSRGMTLKAALAELDLGGGKGVIIGDPKTDRTEGLYRSFGIAVERLGGEYVTGEDSGTGVREVDWIARETSHVIGTSATGGDPADMTAMGVVEAIRAALRRTGRDGLAGAVVAVQGMGHVGAALCRQLAAKGVRLVVADIVPERASGIAAELGAEIATPERIHAAEADVFSPCALGGAINGRTVPELRCAVVAGSANNQLAEPADGAALHRRGILYAPDYVANSGGLISVRLGQLGEDPKGALVQDKIRRIGVTLDRIFALAASRGAAPDAVADELAAERIERRRAELMPALQGED